MKTCTQCGITKKLSEFNIDKAQKSGYRPNCKVCCRKYYTAHIVEHHQYNKEYHLKNCKKIKQYYIDNKEKILKREKKRREKHPEKYRNWRLKTAYGISIQDYDCMWKNQNGVCAICGKKETRKDSHSNKITRIHIDHNHKTGKVRGLLCSKCNQALGLFKEDINTLASAITYLEKHLVH